MPDPRTFVGRRQEFEELHQDVVVHDLSRSLVNEEIEDLECRLTRFDDAARITTELEPGAWMCKLDIEAVYRDMPVRVDNRHPLDMVWGLLDYCDKCLPFGLTQRSSCSILERQKAGRADSVNRILRRYH